MKKRIAIKIDWELFQAGRQDSNTLCPVALFLRRNKQIQFVNVDYSLITFEALGCKFQIIPSQELQDWMTAYDTRRYTVGPKTFTETVTSL
jgi:hypothetical protein